MAFHLRPRLLPFLTFFCVLMLGVRVGDVWHTLMTGEPFEIITGSAAQSTPPAAAPAKPTPAPAAESAAPVNPATAAAATAESRGDVPLTEEQIDVLQHLSERRETLDQRARQLDERDALMKVAEQRIDQKMVELTALRTQLQGMLKQEDDQQKAQIESLVKIYEDMKPKEAARIFDGLDMPVLLNVVGHMKESKSAPILAAMDPAKAKDVTLSLAARAAPLSLPTP